MSSQKQSKTRPLEHLAALFLFAACIIVVLYWGVRIASSRFAEPLQLAVVGHYAPWRDLGSRKKGLVIGTERRQSDLVLYDRKASAEHLMLERQGGKGRWWAIVTNRSHDRRLIIRRAQNPHRTISVNRYQLKDQDRFILPLQTPDDTLGTTGLQGIDWCSPSGVLQLLRKAQHLNAEPKQQRQAKASQKLKTHNIPFIVRMSRWPIQPFNYRLRLIERQKAQSKQIWLSEHQSFLLPKEIGGGKLEYRLDKWQQYKKGAWHSFSQGLSWRKGRFRMEQVRRPVFSAKPRYELGQARAPCRFPIREKAIPGGLEVAGIAKLYFQHNRLYLQHLGQSSAPLQLIPQTGDPKLLGKERLYTGDLLSIGQLTYRVHIDEHGVRLMITRSPTARYLIPFFQTHRSEHLTMRRTLLNQRKLFITGGEGTDPQADRWHIRLSLAGEPDKSQLPTPYRPFFSVESKSSKKFELKALEQSKFYRSNHLGKLVDNKALSIAQVKPDQHLYYINRLYFRLFQPSYNALAWRIALLWVIFAGGMSLLLYWLITIGKVPLSPLPPNRFLQGLSRSDIRRSLLTSEDQIKRSWLQRALLFFYWLPGLGLLPAALFLNGLGIYVLATLCLSSLGLNNNAFLYRQLLWSLVGVVLFLAILAWPVGWFKKLWQRLRKSQEFRVHVDRPIHHIFYKQKLFLILSIIYFISWLLLSLLFKALFLLVPALVLYSFGFVILLEWQKRQSDTQHKKSLIFFFITLGLLAFVPILGILVPPLVHNRFFLKLGFGTVKLSDFAILSAIVFFAYYLGNELFALRLIKARRRYQEQQNISSVREVSIQTERRERLGGAVKVGVFYLFLLGSIGVLYTAQGDLGPGLILTVCFSIYLLFAFIGSGVDRLTTLSNFVRIGIVFGGILTLLWLPDIMSFFLPEWAAESSELQKVQERLSLWNQPWRFLVGEQLLQNQWALASYKDTFQWFNNLHSDFVLTAVARVLSSFWAYVVILLTCSFPLMTLGSAWMRWFPISPHDPPALLTAKRTQLIRSLIILFSGVYLFAQNFIHIGSVLRLTPMTGVTLTWVSSGGTSLIVCYIVLAMIYRQMRRDLGEASEADSQLLPLQAYEPSALQYEQEITSEASTKKELS